MGCYEWGFVNHLFYPARGGSSDSFVTSEVEKKVKEHSNPIIQNVKLVSVDVGGLTHLIPVFTTHIMTD